MAILVTLLLAGSLPVSFDKSQLALGGVTLGDQPAQVLTVLGEPLSKVGAKGVYVETWKYSGLEITFSGGAEIISSTEGTFCTPAGVCPGMSLSKADDAYGTGTRQTRSNGQFVTYSAPGGDCVLEAKIVKQTIRRLSVLCQP